MRKQNRRPIRPWKLVIYVYMLLILMSLLTVASYTWFTLTKTPRVSDLYMFVNAPKGLELSADPEAEDEDWLLQLDFRDLVDETTPLRPVTWSNVKQQFFAAAYGFDGRLQPTVNWEPLTDERHANKDNLDGYYIKVTFYARTDQAVEVSLSPAVEVDEGIDGSGTYLIGTPIWEEQEILHSNGGQGAECAVRIGFRITRLNEEHEPDEEQESVFLIYEPNSDLHINGPAGYIPTPSIDNTPHLVDEEFIIRQSASTWTEAYPVERGVVIHELGEFEEEPKLFTMAVDEMVKIDLYIWLEGQDVDCTNRIEQAQILASIQFAAKPDGQSGLVPIESQPPETLPPENNTQE